MARSVSGEKKRIERAIAHVLKKLNCNYNFIAQDSPSVTSILTVDRSRRGSQDRNTYLVGYNSALTVEMSTNKLRQAILHEWLHAASWDLYDEIENLIKKIKTKSLKKEIEKRYLDIRENVVYNIERSVGPHVFPYIKYED